MMITYYTYVIPICLCTTLCNKMLHVELLYFVLHACLKEQTIHLAKKY